MSYILLIICEFNVVTDFELGILKSIYSIILLYLQGVIEKNNFGSYMVFANVIFFS